MSDTIIRVENLGKKYLIGHQQEGTHRYVALRDVITQGAKSILKTLKNPQLRVSQNTEEFWALKDVSFEVKQGEVVGIIGCNGAGKSTLLKILSRITEPTTGKIEINGRVASLLEVGTGFHPELTGRENIYLNGAILGMSREEIKRKFDEIVAFAEVEKFLDTPVKRYSSGMYVRLAFSVAAHLEPEILVVDEVLAVGDASFQKKCLGKMGDVATKEGRTVLFVSHNMTAIKSLCQTGILLKEGQIYEKGSSSKVVDDYLYLMNNQNKNLDGLIVKEQHYHKESKGFLFQRITLLNQYEQRVTNLLFREPLIIKIEFELEQYFDSGVRMGIVIRSLDDHVITAFHQTDDEQSNIMKLPTGKYVAKMQARLDLMPGHYKISLFTKPMPGFWNSFHDSLDYIENALIFSIEEPFCDNDHYEPSILYSGSIVLPKSNWSIIN